MIALEPLNRNESLRYMGGAGVKLNDEMTRLMDDCEARLLRTARPKYLYKIIDLAENPTEENIASIQKLISPEQKTNKTNVPIQATLINFLVRDFNV